MKTIICLLLLACAEPLLASAPDSIAGKVYREYFLFSGITNAGEATLVFRNDGRYVWLKHAVGVRQTMAMDSTSDLPLAHWGAIHDPPPDGRFQYVKTSDTDATLTLLPDDDERAFDPWTLHFTTASSGSSKGWGLHSRFYLTDSAGDQSQALANASTRGQVSAGKPLILGFVIPGTVERELLIRVVGPALTTLGVSAAATNTSFQIYSGASPIFGASFRFPHWSDVPPAGIFFNYVPSPQNGLDKIFAYVGAFPLPSGSKDSAVVIRLAPGVYTVVADAGTGDAVGDTLIELYQLPY